MSVEVQGVPRCEQKGCVTSEIMLKLSMQGHHMEYKQGSYLIELRLT